MLCNRIWRGLEPREFGGFNGVCGLLTLKRARVVFSSDVGLDGLESLGICGLCLYV